MGTILLVFLVTLAWFVFGCFVLAAIDEDGQLFEWAKRAPAGLYVPTVMLWPVLLAVIWYRRSGHD